MKRLLLLAAIFIAVQAQAQNIVTDDIVLNGLVIGEKYSRVKILSALKGHPTNIKTPKEMDEYPEDYIFYYGKNAFYWQTGIFWGFDVYTPTFCLNNCIRVGDDISKIDLLKGVKTHVSAPTSDNGNHPGIIYWKPADLSMFEGIYVTFYYNANNKIIEFDCFILEI